MEGKCIRRECQCTDVHGVGNGNHTCKSKYKIFCAISFLLYSKKKLIYSVQPTEDSAFHSPLVEVPITSKCFFSDVILYFMQ